METLVYKYKVISNELLELMKEKDINNSKVSKLFEERDNIIKNLNENNKVEEFRKIYIKELAYIDYEIKELLQHNIDIVKKEIVEHKKNKSMNYTYSNMNKMNLNIFYKKV